MENQANLTNLVNEKRNTRYTEPLANINMKHHLLFDNNIYRPLMTSKNGEFLQNFNESIKKHKIISNISSDSIYFSITPFSIMEALGIIIPYPKITIPSSLLTKRTFKEGFKFLKKEAEVYFLNLEELKPESLLRAAKVQSAYSNNDSKELESIFIYKPLKTKEFNDYFIQGLVFDYLCKYEFTQEIQSLIFSEFLIPTFLMNDREVSRFSKFRIIKRLWDNSYHELEKSTVFPINYIRELNQAMKLKRNKDFLDCEIIHFSTIGDLENNTHNPVFSFTMDEKSNVINRVIVYKSMINLIINKLLTEKQYFKYRSIIDSWKQGMIIFCDVDGKFLESIDVSNIRAIN